MKDEIKLDRPIGGLLNDQGPNGELVDGCKPIGRSRIGHEFPS